MAKRASWDEIKGRRPMTPGQREGYERARRAFMLGGADAGAAGGTRVDPGPTG